MTYFDRLGIFKILFNENCFNQSYLNFLIFKTKITGFKSSKPLEEIHEKQEFTLSRAFL